jgi:hypothetical protein
MAVFPILDFAQINARYPKAVKRITEWIFEQPEMKAVTEEYIDPKHPKESKEQFTGLLIQMDPRKLYDVFDSFEIYISITQADEGQAFSYSNNHDNAIYNAPGRHIAEVSAFHDAFEILEKQL